MGCCGLVDCPGYTVSGCRRAGRDLNCHMTLRNVVLGMNVIGPWVLAVFYLRRCRAVGLWF